ncbi:hypothetical protein Avbf_18850 [Armadillidium vulgare]|nr:hypothetical protein Avbf_18850 [Armadillidium vulgare]
MITCYKVKYKKGNEKNQSEVSYVVKLNPKRPPGPMSDTMEVMFPREEVTFNVNLFLCDT